MQDLRRHREASWGPWEFHAHFTRLSLYQLFLLDPSYRLSSRFPYADRRYDNNRSVDVSYYDDNGFVGIYAHDGKTGKITSDVSLDLTIYSAGAYVSDFSVGVNNPIVIEGQNLGKIDGLAGYARLNSNGVFRDNNDLGTFSNNLYSSGSIVGAFSDRDTTEGNPSLVAGEVKIRYGDYDNRTKNSLVGVFAAGVDE